MRGRRDVRNTVFIPNPEPPLSNNGPSVASNAVGFTAPGIAESGATNGGSAEMTAASNADDTNASPIKAPAIIPEERTISDTTSIHSAQSLGNFVHHPDMHEAGLNASIVETVSTWFSDGTVNKSFVVGEVALAYNPTQPAADVETIRLENIQM